MSLFPPPGNTAEQPNTTGQPSQPKIIQAEEIWHNRYLLWSMFAASVILLTVWGYVVFSSVGLFVAGLVTEIFVFGLAGWYFRRQVRQAKTALAGRVAAPKKWWQNIPAGLAIILVLGLGLNLFILVKYPQPLRYDSYQYSRMAYEYTQKGYTPDAIRPPGYTLLLAAIDKIAGGALPEQDTLFGPPLPASRNVQAAQLVQALLLSLTALLTYLLIVELGRKKVLHFRRLYLGDGLGLLAAALVALCPFLIAYTTVTLTEIAAAFWLTLAVWLWVKSLKYSGVLLYPLLTGVAMGGLLMTRPTFIYLPLLTLFTLAVFARGWKRLYAPLIAAVALALVLVPQSVANLQTFDEPNPVIAADLSTYQTAVGIYYITYGGLPRYQTQTSEVNPDPTTEAIWSRLSNYLPVQSGLDNGKTLSKQVRKEAAKVESDFFKKFFSDYVTANPVQYAGTVAKRLWFMWDQHFVFPYYDPGYFDYRLLTDNLNRLYLVAGLVGLIVAIRRWGKYAWPLWLSLFYLVGVNALVRIEFRYTLPGYPLLLAFAALGLWEVITAVRGGEKTYRQKLFAGAGVALLLVIILSASLPLIPPTNAAREKALDTMAQAEDFNEIRQFWKAEPLYNEAIIMYPSEAQLWSGRGNYFAGTNELNKAIPDYSKAIELDPRASDPYRWRGQAYVKLGRATEARTDYLKFLALAPANHPARSKVERELQSMG